MERTYFLAADKTGKSWYGHDNGDFAINTEKVDILWHSWGVQGDALEHFNSRDRTDRAGFIWYKTPPTIKGSHYHSLWDMIDGKLVPPKSWRDGNIKREKKSDSVALRKSGLLSDERGKSYNIWSEEEGRDYIIFAVEGEHLKTKDLEGKVDLAYYAGRDNTYISPLWEKELLVRTTLIPTDKIKYHSRSHYEVVESYNVRKNTLAIEKALEAFSRDCTWLDEIYEDRIKRRIQESLPLQRTLCREKTERKGLFSSKTIQEIVPMYAMESLETVGHTLCAVVRGPLQFDSWGILQRQ